MRWETCVCCEPTTHLFWKCILSSINYGEFCGEKPVFVAALPLISSEISLLSKKLAKTLFGYVYCPIQCTINKAEASFNWNSTVQHSGEILTQISGAVISSVLQCHPPRLLPVLKLAQWIVNQGSVCSFICAPYLWLLLVI